MAEPLSSLQQVALRALKLMDLTTLNDDDTDEKIIQLCHQAKTAVGNTAAICIYPRFIPIARKTLDEQGTLDIKIATVTNFPHGNDDINAAVAETKVAIAYGADEVDVVFPYRTLIAGDVKLGFELVKQCKQACGDKTLKVIIETGMLKTASLIQQASEIAIDAGADFIKTSTGKVSINATPEAAQIMLTVIKNKGVAQSVGFKAAGGVKTAEDALIYLTMADDILGSDWSDKQHYRFGASSLLTNLLQTLGYNEKTLNSKY